MKQGFRQNMAWLHTWTGLVLGWLLFAVFLTGTLAYFRSEITLWMTPELHAARPGQAPAQLALDRLAELAPEADSWSVTLPSERSPVLGLSWRDPGQPQQRGAGQVMDPATGALLTPRDTAGGNFLYRFHFELHGLPREAARWIVGVATMAMFVAILSGVITHKKIFKDFFTFRPRKGQRSWLDLHNMTAVLALPYHLMITYSGLLLFTATLLPFVVEGRTRQAAPRTDPPPALTAPAPLVPIAPLLAEAQARWDMPAGRISVEGRLSARPEITLSPARNDSLATQGGGGGGGARLRFDGTTGALLEETLPPRVSAITATHNVLGALHRGRFADTDLRWLFFLSGLAGTVMVGTGLLLWTAKRGMKHAKSGVTPLGFRLVERLNVGGIAGLSLATAGDFWANRLLPVRLDQRAEAEIAVFFALWAAAVLHPFLRGPARAWPEQLGLTALLLLGLPLLNPATGGAGLPQAVAQGSWILASFDLAALVCGAAYALAWWYAGPRKRRLPSPAPRLRAPRIAGE